MLQKAPDELVGGQRHALPALSLGVAVAEADLAVLEPTFRTSALTF
jgi:hypothetical protein